MITKVVKKCGVRPLPPFYFSSKLGAHTNTMYTQLSNGIKKLSFYRKIYNDLFGLKNDFITFATQNSPQRNNEEF